jgi:hypothetical protein
MVVAGTLPRLVDYLLNAKASSMLMCERDRERESVCVCGWVGVNETELDALVVNATYQHCIQ